MNEPWYLKDTWINKKIPKKERLMVRYTNHETLIAILTQEFYTGDFKMYRANNEDKTLTLLGKSVSPFKLEEKYLTTVEKPNYGYAIKEVK